MENQYTVACTAKETAAAAAAVVAVATTTTKSMSNTMHTVETK